HLQEGIEARRGLESAPLLLPDGPCPDGTGPDQGGAGIDQPGGGPVAGQEPCRLSLPAGSSAGAGGALRRRGGRGQGAAETAFGDEGSQAGAVHPVVGLLAGPQAGSVGGAAEEGARGGTRRRSSQQRPRLHVG